MEINSWVINNIFIEHVSVREKTNGNVLIFPKFWVGKTIPSYSTDMAKFSDIKIFWNFSEY